MIMPRLEMAANPQARGRLPSNGSLVDVWAAATLEPPPSPVKIEPPAWAHLIEMKCAPSVDPMRVAERSGGSEDGSSTTCPLVSEAEAAEREVTSGVDSGSPRRAVGHSTLRRRNSEPDLRPRARILKNDSEIGVKTDHIALAKPTGGMPGPDGEEDEPVEFRRPRCDRRRWSVSGVPIRSVPAELLPPAGVPSLGSVLHGTGSCRPCAWFWRPTLCSNGVYCSRCHSCPDGEVKARKKAKWKLKKEQKKTDTTEADDPAAMEEDGDGQEGNVQTPIAQGTAQADGAQETVPQAQQDAMGAVQPTESPSRQLVSSFVGTDLFDSLRSDQMPAGLLWAIQQHLQHLVQQQSMAMLHLEVLQQRKEKEMESQRKKESQKDAPPEPEESSRRKKKKKKKSNSTTDIPDDVLSPQVSLRESAETEAVSPTKTLSQAGQKTIESTDIGTCTPKPSEQQGTSELEKAAEPEKPRPRVTHPAYTGPLPSVGSEAHGTTNCRPCAWFWKGSGCANGKDCRHCHLCPQDEIKSRKKNKSAHLRDQKRVPSMETDQQDPSQPAKIESQSAEQCIEQLGDGKQQKGCTDAVAPGHEVLSGTLRSPISAELRFQIPMELCQGPALP